MMEMVMIIVAHYETQTTNEKKLSARKILKMDF